MLGHFVLLFLTCYHSYFLCTSVNLYEEVHQKTDHIYCPQNLKFDFVVAESFISTFLFLFVLMYFGRQTIQSERISYIAEDQYLDLNKRLKQERF